MATQGQLSEHGCSGLEGAAADDRQHGWEGQEQSCATGSGRLPVE